MMWKREDVVAEFLHTWDRHGGKVSIAAGILEMTPVALSRALYRARKDGVDLRFLNDVKAWNNSQKSA